MAADEVVRRAVTLLQRECSNLGEVVRARRFGPFLSDRESARLRVRTLQGEPAQGMPA